VIKYKDRCMISIR